MADHTWNKGMPEDIERICVSIKRDDLAVLDEKVNWLKSNGWPAMNRSRLLRIAVGALDVGRMIAPHLDKQPVIEEPIVVPRGRKTRDKRPDRAKREAAVAVWHCGYCGEAGHNVRTCPYIEDGIEEDGPAVIMGTKEDEFG